MSNLNQDRFKEKFLERRNEARLIRKIVLIISIVILLTVSGVVGGGFFYIKSALKPVNPDSKQSIDITIPIGSSISTIGNILEEKGIIRNATVFRYYTKFKNETDFMAGDYQLSPSMTIQEIIDNLKTGKVMENAALKITIPEGKQLEQIATIISEKTDYSKAEIIKKFDDRNYLQILMKKYPDILTKDILQKEIKHPLEGYLFPATYSFHEKNPKIEEIIEAMLDKTSEILKHYQKDMKEQQFTTHKLLTMASLIEEEATQKTDREMIASVFYNRLEIGMPLQTDPTVLYALGKHKDRVVYKDLEVASPYNTYNHNGLPPGPIANAGEMSISAALHPAKTDYFYFLATPSGKVIYTKTLEEHNEQKAKYITNQ